MNVVFKSTLNVDVAYHESGHFVVAHALGLHEHIHVIDIRPAQDYAGVCMGELPALRSDEDYEDAITELYAGLAAELYHNPAYPVASRARAADDDAKAEYLMEDLEAVDEGLVERLRLRAGQLVEENWAAVEALAEALLRKGHLYGLEAEAIVESVQGAPRTPSA